MKKCTAMLAALALSIGLLTGCGDSYKVTESTVFVEKDGTIVSTDIEAFDTSVYDESGLETYVNEAISEYTDEHGKDSVKLKELSFSDGSATLSIEYASVKDYSDFNEIELFSGSVAEALAAGYSFDGDFAEFKDGNKTLCDASAFMDTDGYKVVIIKANTNVHVSGKVKYASCRNAALIDSSTVAISAEYNDADDTVAEETESTGTTEADELDVMSTEAVSTDEGGIEDDEFVLEDEDTEVVFTFEEQERPKSDSDSSSGSYTSVYTYIIYK